MTQICCSDAVFNFMAKSCNQTREDCWLIRSILENQFSSCTAKSYWVSKHSEKHVELSFLAFFHNFWTHLKWRAHYTSVDGVHWSPFPLDTSLMDRECFCSMCCVPWGSIHEDLLIGRGLIIQLHLTMQLVILHNNISLDNVKNIRPTASFIQGSRHCI